MKNIKIIYFLLGILIFAGLTYLLFNYNKHTVLAPNVNIDTNSLTGIQIGNYPWPAETDNLDKRLTEIGLPKLQTEGAALHIHQHLDIFIDGQQVAIPSGAGMNEKQKFLSPIHTHDNTGIIHVESPVVQSFYLGQFFDIWGLRFNSSCIGGYCSNGDKTLKVFVNGDLFKQDPRTIELQPHQEIVITCGTISEMPFPVPYSYTFPPNY